MITSLAATALLTAVLTGASVGTTVRAEAPPTPAHAAVWPLDPRPAVAAAFAAPEHTWSAGHRGVDLVGRPGQQVRAALTGVVSFSGTIAGRGVVAVDHGGFRTTYEPVAATVTRGAHVSTGAVIGTLQAAQGHCPPRTCLHWGLIEDGTYRDPLSLLGLGPVRLLPT